MFKFEVDKEIYALKPMNCPGHWYACQPICVAVYCPGPFVSMLLGVTFLSLSTMLGSLANFDHPA